MFDTKTVSHLGVLGSLTFNCRLFMTLLFTKGSFVFICFLLMQVVGSV